MTIKKIFLIALLFGSSAAPAWAQILNDDHHDRRFEPRSGLPSSTGVARSDRPLESRQKASGASIDSVTKTDFMINLFNESTIHHKS